MHEAVCRGGAVAAKAIDIMVEEFRQGTGAAFGLFDVHDVPGCVQAAGVRQPPDAELVAGLTDVQAKLEYRSAGADRRGRLR